MKENGLISVNYLLNNGRIVSRAYRVNELKYKDKLQEIRQSSEYKLSKVELFKRKIEEVDSIRISNNMFGSKTATITNRAEISELVDAIKKDVLSDNYGNIYDYTYEYERYGDDGIYLVSIMYKNVNSRDVEYYTTETLHFNKKCVNLYNFIESKAQEVQVKAEEIERIEIHDNNGEIVKVIQDRAEIEKALTDIKNFNVANIVGNVEDVAYEGIVEVKFTDGTVDWVELYQ